MKHRIRHVVWFVFALCAAGCGARDADQQRPPAATGAVSRVERKVVMNSIGMRLAAIPAGEFLMGSADSDPDAAEDEKPRHRVRITKPFHLGVYEVTQGEFQGVMGRATSFFSPTGAGKDLVAGMDAARFPAEQVRWHDAVEFCRRLSELPEERRAGRVYRLPTEAEWEYACRAGTETAFHFGNSLSSAEANFNGKFPFGGAAKGPFRERTMEVGSFAPNAWGLYDMHGNVQEWCADWYARDYFRHSPTEDPTGPEKGLHRVIRGGEWYSDGRDCRSAFRYADLPGGTFYVMGFRVVMELGAESGERRAESGGPVVTVPALGEEPRRGAAGIETDVAPEALEGEDWPQWRGPRSNGTWDGPQLPDAWPEAGLVRRWAKSIGGGYGGVAVAEGRVYVMDRQEAGREVERVLCFESSTGRQLWAYSYGVDYKDVSYGNGPRATPTVFDGRVYTFGAVGHLHCLDAADGSVVWSKDLVRDFGARIPIWGLSASPVVFENLVIVHPGAEPDGCLIAFDRQSGEEVWRSLPDEAGYATPIVIDNNGSTHLVAWTPANVHGLDPRSGERFWSVPFVATNSTSIATPIFEENIVLVSGYYEGAKAIQLGPSPTDAELLWQDRRNLRDLMSQPLYRDGHAYLLDKRFGLTCFELKTGNKLWDAANRMTPKGRNPQATMVWLGQSDRAIVLNSEGDLILAGLTPEGYEELSRANIIGPTWAHPAYAGGFVYARSDTVLVCVSLTANPMAVRE